VAGSDLSVGGTGFARCLPDGAALRPASLCTEAWAAPAGQHHGVPGRGVPRSREGVGLPLAVQAVQSAWASRLRRKRSRRAGCWLRSPAAAPTGGTRGGDERTATAV